MWVWITILALSLALVRCERAEPVTYTKLTASQQAYFVGLLESRNPVQHRKGQQAFQGRWNKILGFLVIILLFPLGLWFEKKRKSQEEKENT